MEAAWKLEICEELLYTSCRLFVERGSLPVRRRIANCTVLTWYPDSLFSVAEGLRLCEWLALCMHSEQSQRSLDSLPDRSRRLYDRTADVSDRGVQRMLHIADREKPSKGKSAVS